jgi:hypothetical protein
MFLVKTKVDETHSVVETSQQRTRDAQKHQWLSPSDPSVNQDEALQRCQKGTGQWFLNSQAFTRFKEGNIPLLWLHGIPGCGKTILTSSIVKALEIHPPDTATAILYFYFDFNDNQKQTLDSALRSLLWQAASYHKGSSGELEQLYTLCKDGKRQPSVQDLGRTLDRMLLSIGHARVVLDALDECMTRPALLPWLVQMAMKEGGSVQVIATSRREHDIEVAFKKAIPADCMMPINQIEVDKDIRTYVHARILDDPDLERWKGKPKVQDKIEEELMSKADGM